jgi:RNA polymerase sigma-70 factor, ECF subfamily
MNCEECEKLIWQYLDGELDGVSSGDLQRHPHAQTSEDAKLIEALRTGDEQAFASLVRRHYTSMLNVTMNYISSRAVAEEVVQEAWLGVLNGLDQFEARSSLKTWIFSLLINRAKTCVKREGRTLPFSSIEDRGDDPAEPCVDPGRFLDGDHSTWRVRFDTPPSLFWTISTHAARDTIRP